MAKRTLIYLEDGPDAKRPRIQDDATPVAEVASGSAWTLPLLPDIWRWWIYEHLTNPIHSIHLARTCTGLHALWRPSTIADLRSSDVLRRVCLYNARVNREALQGPPMTMLPIWKMRRQSVAAAGRLYAAWPATILNRICPILRSIRLSSDYLVTNEPDDGGAYWPRPWDWDVIQAILRHFVAKCRPLERVEWRISDPPPEYPLDLDSVMPRIGTLGFVRRLIVDTPGDGDSPCSCPFAAFPNITRLSIRDIKMTLPGPSVAPMLQKLTRLTLHLDHLLPLLRVSVLPSLRRLKLHDRNSDSELIDTLDFIRAIGNGLRTGAPLLAFLVLVVPWREYDRRAIKASLDFVETFVWSDDSAYVARIYKRGKYVETRDFMGRGKWDRI